MDAGIQRSVKRGEMNTRVYYAFIDTAATLKWIISILYLHKLQNKCTRENWNKSAHSWESSFRSGMISYPEDFFPPDIAIRPGRTSSRTKQRDQPSHVQTNINLIRFASDLLQDAAQDCATPPKSDVEPSCQTWWLWWGIDEHGSFWIYHGLLQGSWINDQGSDFMGNGPSLIWYLCLYVFSKFVWFMVRGVI